MTGLWDFRNQCFRVLAEKLGRATGFLPQRWRELGGLRLIGRDLRVPSTHSVRVLACANVNYRHGIWRQDGEPVTASSASHLMPLPKKAM